MKSFRFFGRDLKIRRIPNFPMPFTNLNNGNYRNNSTNCTPLKFIAIELIHTEKKTEQSTRLHTCIESTAISRGKNYTSKTQLNRRLRKHDKKPRFINNQPVRENHYAKV